MGDKLYAIARVERCKGLLKIAKIFKLGYIPSRENQTYSTICKSTGESYSRQANCFEHACLNLTNQQLKKLSLGDEAGDLFDIHSYDYEDTTSMQETFVDRLKLFGLIAESCPADYTPKNKNQWKVALYFGYSRFCGDTDFHLLKQEKDGSWSSKIGWSDDVEILPSLPEKYIPPHGTEYVLYNTYIITNPYADKGITEVNTKEKTDGQEL